MSRSSWVVAAALFVCACAADGDGVSGDDNYAGPIAGTADDDGGGGGGAGDDGGTGDEGGTGGDDGGGSTGSTPADTDTPQGVLLSTGCPAYGADVYTPFPTGVPVSAGTPGTKPWRGLSSYPASLEDFRAYGPTMPQVVECGSAKTARDHLDVTAGCLRAVSADGGKAGQIQLTADGYYRSFALPYDPAYARRVAWADQGVEYRFKFSAWTGNEGNPGFKAFARYLTEYDLYVASWRRDGTVQIQKKQCGTYTILARNGSYGAPAPNVWHTIRFQAVGSELRLYLDGRLAMTAKDSSIARGTAGIRIDSADGALIDDWRTYAP